MQSNTSNTVIIADNGTQNSSRVLVVEDNLANQNYLFALLDSWNIPYDLASNGLEALSFVERRDYVMIFMDIRMPVMDGYEATRAIRRLDQNHNRNIPIVALTASTLVDQKEKAFAAGMNYYVSKPYSPNDLEIVLSKFNIFEKVNSSTPSSFQFSDQLDHDFLQEFYQDDLGRAELMFDVFLKIIDEEVSQLEKFMDDQNWEAFSSQAHKIKPNFQMVGLPVLSQKMKSYESAKSDVDLRKMITLEFQDWKSDFFAAKEKVMTELDRIKKFNSL